VAEQLSVLAEERNLGARELTTLIPNINQRHLPMIPDSTRGGGFQNLEEREILYKLLFEMKSDMTDLKKLVFELIRRNDLNVPDLQNLKRLGEPQFDNNRGYPDQSVFPSSPSDYLPEEDSEDLPSSLKPIILDKDDDTYEKAEVVEENLSLEDMEKDLIQKALQKHNGRRKDAAQDLGISERTLYRKIKQYQL
jgi:AraC-like DNA-binding protein